MSKAMFTLNIESIYMIDHISLLSQSLEPLLTYFVYLSFTYLF